MNTTDEITALADMVQRFATREVAPHAAQWDEAGEFPRGLYARAAELGVRMSKWHNSRVRAVAHLDAPIGLIAEHGPKIAQALAEVLA